MSGLNIQLVKRGEVLRRLGAAGKRATDDTLEALMKAHLFPLPVVDIGEGTGRRRMWDAEAVDLAIYRLKQRSHDLSRVQEQSARAA